MQIGLVMENFGKQSNKMHYMIYLFMKKNLLMLA